LDRRQLCEALLSTTGDEGAAHCAKRAKRIFAQRLLISDVLRSNSEGECGEALADIICCMTRRASDLRSESSKKIFLI